MAESLSEYRPSASKFTIKLKSGVGGTSKITKSAAKEHAPVC